MQSQNSIFLNDVPVSSVDDNKLWSNDSDIVREVNEIAHAILWESGRLTFAVHGAWGAGKTSFLQMIEHTVQNKQDAQEVLFCWYNASAYQGLGLPETTIALRMWNILGGENPVKGRHGKDISEGLYTYMKDILSELPVQEAKPVSDIKPYELLQMLARRTGQLADFPRLLEQLLIAGGPDGLPKKFALIVDDLDRCHSTFIASILDALQRFSSVSNLFILIGVDRDVLLNAIRERYKEVMSVRDEHLALEKYIQFSIDLPEMQPNSLKSYIQRCLIVDEDSDDDSEKMSVQAIRNNADYFVAGVRVKTPRAIKRSINAIRPVLKLSVEQNPELSEEAQQLIIKEQLLAYNWRTFYQRYFHPAKHDSNSVERRIFAELERLCELSYPVDKDVTPEQQRDRRAIFDLQLERIKKREFTESAHLEIEDSLAKLLAQKPFWFLGQQKGQFASRPTDDILDRIATMNFENNNLDEEFLRLYLIAEQAEIERDAKTCIQATAQAYDLVRQNTKFFGKDTVGRLGNLGVNAERYRVGELAEAIFRLALEIDPEHSGVLQQFTSYILDNDRSDLFPEVQDILDKLQTSPHSSHKPWRTARFVVQYRTAIGEEIDDTFVTQLMDMAQSAQNANELGTILVTLIQVGQIQQSLKVYQAALNRFHSGKSVYLLQRMVADALANSSEGQNECIAMDLYRDILASQELIEPGDKFNVIHNYATLLYNQDYDDEAGRLWYEAYQDQKGRIDTNVRRAYSMYLMRAERQDLATKVVNGEPIEELVLITSNKELPEKFSDISLPKTPNIKTIKQIDGSQ